ncbi:MULTISPECIES: ABC transporter ATP-binding protein [Metabacillus]|uniref:Multidrug ABC transporter permease n=4 Tax=Bacillaceae TaxID=186817 RepID=A0A179SQ98_9BACI|nr:MULTISPECIES: ABC transporter ATP-binding protein [Metabacillus]OAS83059.1 multidrug ABC transporter permease [Metabacillus litoralis]QNF27613.1 ABC transporter ATP-binding protein [Metabacillus sp. KUDC1714]
MKSKSTGRRLLHYALLYKKTIIIALAMLTFAVAAELTGPFLAKKMIDDHMIGIESPWVEVTNKDDQAVLYNEHYFKRSSNVTIGDSLGDEEIQIIQVGRSFYVTNEHLPFDGERSISGDMLTISNGSDEESYEVDKLNQQELFAFYQPEIRPIILLLSFYVGLLFIAAFFQYGKSLMLQKAANRIIQKMRTDVFEHIQRVPINYFDNRPAGKIVSRVTNDTEAIRELYVKVLATFFTSGIYMTGIFVALFFLDQKLALITLFLVPIIIIWTLLYRKVASKYNHLIRTRVSDINGIINESIQGMPIIRAFRRKEQTMKEFETLNEEHFTYQNKLLSLNSMTSHNLVNVLRNVTFVVLIWYFGGQSISAAGIVSIGMLYAFVDYLNRLFQPVTDIVNQLAQLEQARVASERVFELLDEKGEAVNEDELPRYEGNVKFHHVSFSYDGENDVLKDISFEAKKGETVALVGHTGSGKSSIINLLFRYYDIDRGSIMIDGMDTSKLPRQQLRKHMGIVLQDPFLFTGTIETNVSLENPAITTEKVKKALQDVGADRFIEKLPNQYEEPVLEKGSTLSAGERQLISFARALAYDPAILILDEATANIDTETEAMIQQALNIVKEGRTTFIIAHRLSTIRNADQILVLDHGEIVESGSHKELLDQKGKYFQMYQLQQGKEVSKVG